ncbi:MAG: twin-arginine translocation signal domain-containing protein, partial [Candidatus Hydrogenedentota bacterium]
MHHRVSRRGFMQAAAGAGAAMTLGAVAGSQAAPLERVRVGIVGVGNRGSALLRALLQLSYVDVPAVCDLLEERTTQAQDLVEQARGDRPAAYTKGERLLYKVLGLGCLLLEKVADGRHIHVGQLQQSAKEGRTAISHTHNANPHTLERRCLRPG